MPETRVIPMRPCDTPGCQTQPRWREGFIPARWPKGERPPRGRWLCDSHATEIFERARNKGYDR